MERISDKRLNEMVSNAEKALEMGDPSNPKCNPRAMLARDVGSEMLSALTELRERREAEQTTPGDIDELIGHAMAASLQADAPDYQRRIVGTLAELREMRKWLAAFEKCRQQAEKWGDGIEMRFVNGKTLVCYAVFDDEPLEPSEFVSGDTIAEALSALAAIVERGEA